jgi:hypothetical protein
MREFSSAEPVCAAALAANEAINDAVARMLTIASLDVVFMLLFSVSAVIHLG